MNLHLRIVFSLPQDDIYSLFLNSVKEDFQIILCIKLNCEVAKLKSRIDVARKACRGDYGCVYVTFYKASPTWGRGTACGG